GDVISEQSEMSQEANENVDSPGNPFSLTSARPWIILRKRRLFGKLHLPSAERILQFPGHVFQSCGPDVQHLKLCLDCVNSCFPFFICLLGQTYGDFLPDYSPVMFSKATDLSSLSIVEQNLYVAAKNCYPWVLENPNCSLMELEIVQAAFLNESQFLYFCFRTGTVLLKPVDEEKEEMLSAGFLINDEEKLKAGKLKAKVISKGLPVRLYRDLHELDFKHNFERFYHEEFTEKCKEVFVISKESNRTFEILERFALKDVEFDFNNAVAGSSLSVL
ncbi:hypothetical protein E2I00_018465, partial [Balaenoptera physalus]